MNNLQQYFDKEKKQENSLSVGDKGHFKSILEKLPTRYTHTYKGYFYIISGVVSATLLALLVFSGNGNTISQQYWAKSFDQKNAVLKAIDDSNSFEEENYEEI